MQKIQNVSELKAAIAALETKKEENLRQLKMECLNAYEIIKPTNLIKQSIKEVVGSQDILQDVLKAVAAMVLGYFTKKSVLGVGTHNWQKALAALLQLAVSGLVSDNSSGIKEKLRRLIQKLISKLKPSS
ncbi:MAG: hypothetical protein IPM48_00705 [Saprospiraceae bacterium]|nr:hypothetical protein [Saprospiraceae bacterium]